jgi:hypothetical protein
MVVPADPTLQQIAKSKRFKAGFAEVGMVPVTIHRGGTVEHLAKGGRLLKRPQQAGLIVQTRRSTAETESQLLLELTFPEAD